MIGLDDLTARYPIGPALATELLERFADEGGLVRLEPVDGSDAPRWADRQNLEEVRRLSIAIRRRESVAVPPEAFADFVARRQHVHPRPVSKASRGRRSGPGAAPGVRRAGRPLGVGPAPERGSAISGPPGSTKPSARATGPGGPGPTRRGEPGSPSSPATSPAPGRSAEEVAEPPDRRGSVLDFLDRRGASFAVDIARETGLGPLAVRAALDGLAASRPGDERPLRPAPARRPGDGRGACRPRRSATARPGRLGGSAGRRRGGPRGDGRRSADRPIDDPESAASGLGLGPARSLRRPDAGRRSRSTPGRPPGGTWPPGWPGPRCGASCAGATSSRGSRASSTPTAEAAEELAPGRPRHRRAASPILLSTLDPANLYGSGAPLDIPLLEGGTARLSRNSSNFLVLIAGPPGPDHRRARQAADGLASASESELKTAISLLPTLAGPSRRVLKVETYNTAATLAGPAAPWLAEVGFVRDPPGMAFYAGW